MRRGPDMTERELLTNGTITSVGDGHLVVEVAPERSGATDSKSDDSEEDDGVELFVGTRTHRTGCSCCGNTTILSVSYNRHEAERIEEHGDADPLNMWD